MLIQKNLIGTIGVMGAVPSVPWEFCWSLAQMIQYNSEFMCGPGEYIHLMCPSTSYHSTARNQLAAGFMGEWLFMMDTDHAFDPDILLRMLMLVKLHNVDVLSALYRYKVYPYLPVAFHWNEETQGFVGIAELDWNAMIQEVSCVGAGCLLVRRGAFDRIREELHEQPFDIIHPWSEDFSFFVRLRKLGIKSCISPLIESYHLNTHRVTSSDYDRSAVQTYPIPSGGEMVVGKA